MYRKQHRPSRTGRKGRGLARHRRGNGGGVGEDRAGVNFAEVNAAALGHLPALLLRWLPHGRREGGEWVALNPRRHDRSPGSFRINLRTGRWADFATDDARGGDPVVLAAYLSCTSQGEAVRSLAAMGRRCCRYAGDDGYQGKEYPPMAKKKPVKGKEKATAVAAKPDDRKGALKAIGGSHSDCLNTMLANQAMQALWLEQSDASGQHRQRNATVDALVGIGPKDELEGMMAAQLIAAHNAAMECYRRAMIGEQTFEGRRENLNQANKLSRTWAMLLDALNKHRGKGHQKVTVEHVHVHAGG